MCFQEVSIFIKQHMMLIIIWSVLLIMVVYTTITNRIRKSFEISCDQVIELMNKKHAIIVDIRDINEYCSGYIIHSTNVPFSQVKNHNFSEFNKLKNGPLIIVGNNKTSYLVKRIFNKLGLNEVYVLKGGINSWKGNNLPLLYKK